MQDKEDVKKFEKDQKEYREHVEEQLKECSFKEVDEKHYSVVFKKEKFIFHLPSFLEKTQIKAILAQITYNPVGTFSGELDIETSGDTVLRSNTKLLTHVSVLCGKKDFDLDSLSEAEQFNFGYFILLSEQEFLERKKKVSTQEQ